MCSAELIFNILQTITQINLSSLCRENYRPANFARNIQKLNKTKKNNNTFFCLEQFIAPNIFLTILEHFTGNAVVGTNTGQNPLLQEQLKVLDTSGFFPTCL